MQLGLKEFVFCLKDQYKVVQKHFFPNPGIPCNITNKGKVELFISKGIVGKFFTCKILASKGRENEVKN